MFLKVLLFHRIRLWANLNAVTKKEKKRKKEKKELVEIISHTGAINIWNILLLKKIQRVSETPGFVSGGCGMVSRVRSLGRGEKAGSSRKFGHPAKRHLPHLWGAATRHKSI